MGELFKEHGIIVSSSADKKKSLLTKNLNFGIVKKLQLLARISASSLDKMVKDGNIDNLKTIFETSHSWFDAVIHLNEFKCQDGIYRNYLSISWKNHMVISHGFSHKKTN